MTLLDQAGDLVAVLREPDLRHEVRHRRPADAGGLPHEPHELDRRRRSRWGSRSTSRISRRHPPGMAMGLRRRRHLDRAEPGAHLHGRAERDQDLPCHPHRQRLGASESSVTHDVTIYPSGLANSTADPTEGSAPLTVQFTDRRQVSRPTGSGTSATRTTRPIRPSRTRSIRSRRMASTGHPLRGTGRSSQRRSADDRDLHSCR